MQSRLLVGGRFRPETVSLSIAPLSNRVVSPAVESRLEQAWQQLLDVAKQKGMNLRDSQVYRLNGWQLHDGHLALELAVSQYRFHTSMKAIHDDRDLRESQLDKSIVVDTLLRTGDDKYLVANVNKVTGRDVYLPGGTCSLERVKLARGQDLFDYAKLRLVEVMRAPVNAIALSSLRGVILNRVGCINIIFEAETSLTSTQLQGSFVPSSGIVSLEAVDGRDLVEYLSRAEGYIQEVAELLK